MSRKDGIGAMQEQPRSATPSGLLQVCWLIANAEAKNLGAMEILPIHFLLAVMKIIDPAFPALLDRLNIPSGEWAAMCEEAESMRRYVEVLPERVTEKRRRLRRRLAAKQVNPPITVEGLLHRSADVKRAFADALTRMDDGETLSFRKFVETLFELEFVSLDDIK